ncbi:MAG: hypothetical protein Q9160_007575 [Pyrenula sp. 1 TL-2023]
MAVPRSNPTQSPYRLDVDQTLKASTALLQHLQRETKRLRDEASKKDLLAVDDEGASESDAPSSNDQPIWLNLSTKKHIADKARLKPGKVKVPHTLNKSPNLSICLITADPQRAVKDAVTDPAFPKALSARITKIIGFSKLKARYRTFESRRQLLAEHDIFLADDRIILRLVETLGKIFYKTTSKRPIPIAISPRRPIDKPDAKSKSQSASAVKKEAFIAPPAIVAQEIERTLDSVHVSTKPGTSIAVKVGWSSFSPAQLSENVGAAIEGMIDRFVAKGWRNIRSIHIKGPDTVALPIWLASDIWTGEDDIRSDDDAALSTSRATSKMSQLEGIRKEKRKTPHPDKDESRPRKKKPTEQDGVKKDKVQAETRKARLLEQKVQAMQDVPS